MLDKVKDFARRNDLDYVALLEELASASLSPGTLDEAFQAARRRLRQRAEAAEQEQEITGFPP